MTSQTFKIILLNIVNFLASFLLFQIELIIAKILLPKFGGSYYIWGACIVFFQCTLLLGYLYSHTVLEIFGIKRYRYFHLLLIFLPLLTFPGRALGEMSLAGNLPIVIGVFLDLAAGIGLVFFVLSTISVISQRWLAASDLPQQKNPYRLYAVSNIGSFAGLLTYPFIFEYNLDLPSQLLFWRGCYIVLLLVYFLAFFLISISESAPVRRMGFSLDLKGQISFDQTLLQRLRWFIFAAASAMIFLAVTNIITCEIVPCPLVWIIPLAIFLLSFILTFRDRPFYPQWISQHRHLVLGFSSVLFFLTKMYIFPIAITMLANLAALFALCMICQHALYESRPSHKNELTFFYVIMSLGNFLGGLFVAWIAPRVFSTPFEFLLGLWLVALGISMSFEKEKMGVYNLALIAGLILTVTIWPLLFHEYNFIGLSILFAAFYFIFSRLKSRPSAATLAIGALLCVAPFIIHEWSTTNEIYNFRNYYGVYSLSIDKDKGVVSLSNGTTLHGSEYLDPKDAFKPTAYYHLHTPVGRLLSDSRFSFQRIGIVGLGAGTLAAYGRRGQVMDFYELDPDIVDVANRFFNFVRGSRAQVNFIVGDARVNLSRSNSLYDVLIIDAFSGDAVPVHLLTTEAIMEYKRHLTKNGAILFHISNRYLDLYPVILSNSHAVGAFALAGKNDAESTVNLASQWALLTWDEGMKNTMVSSLGWKELSYERWKRKIRPWTDKYSCVLSVLNTDQLIGSFKTYMPFYW